MATGENSTMPSRASDKTPAAHQSRRGWIAGLVVVAAAAVIGIALIRSKPDEQQPSVQPSPADAHDAPKKAGSGTTQTVTQGAALPATATADTNPPQIKSMLGNKNYAIRAVPQDRRPDIWAEYGDAESGIDQASVRFFVDDTDVTSQCAVTALRVSWRPSNALVVPKEYRFKVVVSDKAGNKAELVWEMRLQDC
jgi:hypothetical protein